MEERYKVERNDDMVFIEDTEFSVEDFVGLCVDFYAGDSLVVRLAGLESHSEKTFSKEAMRRFAYLLKSKIEEDGRQL